MPTFSNPTFCPGIVYSPRFNKNVQCRTKGLIVKTLEDGRIVRKCKDCNTKWTSVLIND